jgi:hypothetical protein
MRQQKASEALREKLSIREGFIAADKLIKNNPVALPPAAGFFPWA